MLDRFKSYSATAILQVFALILLLSTNSCSNTKYLAEGEELYTGAEFELKSEENLPDRGVLTRMIKKDLRPKPNTGILGLRPSLWIYNMTRNAEKGLFNFIKEKIGNPPVLYSDVRPEFNKKLIINRLSNRGYFGADVSYEVLRPTEKKVQLIYSAKVERPYEIDSIVYALDSSGMSDVIRNAREDSDLEEGMQYRLEAMRSERDRIDVLLKNSGYFYFNTDFIRIEADTTIGDKKMALYIKMDPQMPPKGSRKYRFNRVWVFPNYQLGQNASANMSDTVIVDGITYFANDTANEFRPKMIGRSVFLKRGELYTRKAHERTLNHIMGMGAFKFVDVRFNEVDSTGTGLLDANIYITPLKKKTIRAELSMVSKSNNYTGPGLELGWVNRNTFGGAELLNINTHGGFETQFGGGSEGSFSEFSSYQFGLNAELNVPRFITPFDLRSPSKFVPKTKFGIGFEHVKRVEFFSLSSFNFQAGYVWNENVRKKHQLLPLNINYIRLANTTAEFDTLLDENPFLENSFEERYIAGPEYTFTYNDQVDASRDNHMYFMGDVQASNPFGLLNAFSTYLRFNADYRYYFKLSERGKLIGRLNAGYGYTYGESETMPYIKQFFAGGPSSIRAFQARTLGPGSFRADIIDRFGFRDQNGNIKLIFNLEYRFPIYGMFEGALFADAGNIWLSERDPSQPGANIESDFISEMAMGIGTGLRLNANFFVLRLDFAWPVRKPWRPAGDRWIRPLKSENPVLNLAIGYPF